MNLAEKLIAEHPELVTPKLLKRFWDKVEKTETCWLWTAGVNSDGYGSFRVGGAIAKAHRISYIINIGTIPEGLSVLHRCDVPRCIFPDHFFLGTQTDNTNDMNAKGRHAKGDQIAQRGEDHPMCKLKSEQVDLIRFIYRNETINQTQIAAKFGVSRQTVSEIVRGNLWRHLISQPATMVPSADPPR